MCQALRFPSVVHPDFPPVFLVSAIFMSPFHVIFVSFFQLVYVFHIWIDPSHVLLIF